MFVLISRLQMFETPFCRVFNFVSENYLVSNESNVVEKCDISDKYRKWSNKLGYKTLSIEQFEKELLKQSGIKHTTDNIHEYYRGLLRSRKLIL